MSQVTYYVMYRPIHPNTNKPIIYVNTAYSATDQTMTPGDQMTAFMTNEAAVTNPKNTMLFYYDSIGTKIMPTTSGGSGPPPEYMFDKFKKFKGDVWVIHSIQNSLPAAMKISESLIMDLGTGNVKILKAAEMDIQVVLSKK